MAILSLINHSILSLPYCHTYYDLLEILFNLHFSQGTNALSYFIASPSVLPSGELNVIMCIFRFFFFLNKVSEQQIFLFTVSVTNLYLYGSYLQEEEKCPDLKKKRKWSKRG